MSTRRQIQLAQLHGLGERYGAGRIERAEALDEVKDITEDPDVLAEAVAWFRLPRDPVYRRRDLLGEQLLIDAGADPAAADRHTAQWRERKPTFDLGAFADRANQTKRS